MRAITVTKNVFYGAKWLFNFHVWDATGGTIFAHFDLTSVFDPNGTLVPLPWHLCARTLRGQLEFKAWPSSETEPVAAYAYTRRIGPHPCRVGKRRQGRLVHRPPTARRVRDLRSPRRLEGRVVVPTTNARSR